MSTPARAYAGVDAAREHPEAEHERSHLSRLEQLIHTHLHAVEFLIEATGHHAPRMEWVDLTPATPLIIAQQVNNKNRAKGIALVNPSPVGVVLGWAAVPSVSQGIPVPPQSYLRMPLPEVNRVEAYCPAFGAVTQASIVLLEYDFPPELAAGSLTLGLDGNGNAASAVTPTSPRSVAVGVTSTSVLAANPSRKGSEFENTGTTTISLGLGNAAVAGDDIVLAPSGAWNGLISGVLWLGSVNAISSAAGGTLAVVEV